MNITEFMQQLSEYAEALHQEAQRLLATGEFDAARQCYLELLEQDDRAELWHGLAIALENLKDIPSAAAAYQRAIALDPHCIEAHNSLGNLVAQHGDPAQATLIYQQAIALNPADFGTYLNLGNVLLVQGQAEAAIAAYETGLTIEPQNPDGLHNLALARTLAADPAQIHLFAGTNLHQRQRYAEAVPHFQALVETTIVNSGVYEALTHCHEKLKQWETAIAVARQGLDRYPSIRLHEQLIDLLVNTGQIKAAVAQASRAAAQFPKAGLLRLKKHLLLPILSQSMAEIEQHRCRFTQGLTALLQELPPHTEAAIAAIAQSTNFFLGYQNQNDRALQQQYGQWVHETMAAHYPQWVQPLPMPEVTGRIRIGYVSGCLHDHTVGKLILGWFRHHDRDRFQIHAYHVLDVEDGLGQEFRQHSDVFHRILDLDAICQQVQADRLHVLMFPEIGMQPLMTQLAALRLAPVQCTSWAHPITSGLPTIDYFLSSDLMEPENAQEHYTEKLVRLPNIGIAFAQPNVPAPSKDRSQFGLRPDAVVYLVSQMLSKLLPSQDRTFAAIAQQVPQAQFVFIARPNLSIAKQFLRRLQFAFAEAGLDSDRFCVMLPSQSQRDFWNLNQVCDVFLDSFGWSGGHTTLEAIACDLPIVTLPGAYMRGRHSAAILQRLGVTETIAQSEAEYIHLAVQLGTNAAKRSRLVQQMRDRHPHLYDDATCVRALEAFYQTVVADPGADL